MTRNRLTGTHVLQQQHAEAPAHRVASFRNVVEQQRAYFATGATRSLEFRQAALAKLAAELRRHEPALIAALGADLEKSPAQAFTSELATVYAEIDCAQRNLKRWSAPRKARTPWLSWPAKASVQAEPLGVALIIAPWNYPAALLLTPLVHALAAGCCAVLKASEVAPRTAEALFDLICGTFPEEFVTIVPAGDAQSTTALLRERFDKIFFTGSTRVGRIVAAAAARNLTPVTLELGGRCPAIVCADVNVDVAARRIAWGKFLNAGQTCVAPNHVFVDRRVRDPFVAALGKCVREFYGDEVERSADFGRIINDAHFARVTSYLNDGTIVFGGDVDAVARFVAPTVLVDVASGSGAATEEIFGPILPVIDFNGVDDVLAKLRADSAPLAVYLFTNERALQRRVAAATRSGGVCINDVVVQMLGSELPFGGVGESGIGRYHGRAGFDAFSFERTIMRRSPRWELPFRYPPQRHSLGQLRRAMRWLLR